MVIKLKNISYRRFIKFIIFMLALVCAFVFINGLHTFWKLDNMGGVIYGYGGVHYISGYDGVHYISGYNNVYGTDYYEDIESTLSIAFDELSTIENIGLLIEDNGEHAIQDVLELDINIDTDEIYFNVVDYTTGEVIARSDLEYEPIENITSSRIYFTATTDSKELIDELGIVGSYNYYDNDNAEATHYKEYVLNIMYLDDYIISEIEDFRDYLYKESFKALALVGVSLVSFILILIYYIVVAGKRERESVVQLRFYDRVYLEILVPAVVVGVCLITVAIYYLLNESIFTYNTSMSLIITLGIIAVGLIVYSVVNISKKIKCKKFLESFLVFKILRFAYTRILKVAYRFFITDSTISLKLLIVLGIFASLLSFVSPIFVPLLMALYFGHIIVSIKLVRAIKKVSNNEKFEADKRLKNIPYNTTFADVEKLSKDMNEIYIKGLKAQNTKTELITNVSHDLRTPLTSIVGYVDLLDKSSDDYSDETKGYIKVLKEKSNRMTQMVGDLFELAKTASGDVTLEFSKLNVKKLIEQTINELDDYIVDESKININVDKDLYILADGSKMYRVMQNLIENALKYSMEGTRIYLEGHLNNNGDVQVEIKNISSYFMDFDCKDITERFTRGDKSRTKEGSGLGLSIAETYTNLNNGSFKVVVDGDLFKVVMIFQSA